MCCVPTTMQENSGEKEAGERDREHEGRGRAAANQECVAQIQRSRRAALSVSGPASERAMNFIYHFCQRVQGVVDVEHFYHISKDITRESASHTPPEGFPHFLFAPGSLYRSYQSSLSRIPTRLVLRTKSHRRVSGVSRLGVPYQVDS